jgi:glycosyltransferase involved in cell wall biosynthesis
MRVAYVMSRYPKITETFVLNEMLAMVDLGVDVTVYPLKREKPKVVQPGVARLADRVRARAFWSAGTLVAPFRVALFRPGKVAGVLDTLGRGAGRNWRLLALNFALFPLAARYALDMERAGVDHVHAHFANHPTTVALIIHALTDIPFSFTTHAHDLYVRQEMLCEKVAAADFAVMISEFNRSFVIDQCGPGIEGKLEVIHCGVDTDYFQPAERDESRPFTIVCVGALEEKKGQRYLVDACRLLRERGVEFRCYFIGGGDDAKALQARARDAGLSQQVRFLGPQPRDLVLEMVRRADVVALPSIVTATGKKEGIPVALMEAMACGRAVVSTRTSGIPELVEDGETGLLVELEDAGQLADALERLARDRELVNRFGRAGRMKVVAEFDLARNTARLASRFAAEMTRPTP